MRSRLVVVPVVAMAATLALAVALRSPAPPDASPVGDTGRQPPSTSTTVSLLDACAANLAYWVPKVVSGDPAAGYGDYQTMGLTGPEYEALRALVAEIRAAGGQVPEPGELAGRASAHCSTRALRRGWG